MIPEVILMIIYTVAFIALIIYAIHDLKETADRFEADRKKLEEAVDYLAKSTQQDIDLHHIKMEPLEPLDVPEGVECLGDCDNCEQDPCEAPENISPEEEGVSDSIKE